MSLENIPGGNIRINERKGSGEQTFRSTESLDYGEPQWPDLKIFDWYGGTGVRKRLRLQRDWFCIRHGLDGFEKLDCLTRVVCPTSIEPPGVAILCFPEFLQFAFHNTYSISFSLSRSIQVEGFSRVSRRASGKPRARISSQRYRRDRKRNVGRFVLETPSTYLRASVRLYILRRFFIFSQVVRSYMTLLVEWEKNIALNNNNKNNNNNKIHFNVMVIEPINRSLELTRPYEIPSFDLELGSRQSR